LRRIRGRCPRRPNAVADAGGRSEPTPPVSAFVEDDARLAGMHGYDGNVRCDGSGPHPHDLVKGVTDGGRMVYPPAPTSVRKSDVVEMQKHLERLEAKLDALIVALKAGAIGRWQ
jgi:hypothetical protein